MDAPDLRREAGPHVFVEDLEVPELAEEDRHHLARSLRLRSGDTLTLSDGQGCWRRARFGDPLEVDGPVHTIEDNRHVLTVGVALSKSGKPEFAVQKATELGIDRIVLFPAEHSVVQWNDAKRTKNLSRLRRVAREAAMQSRQVRVPDVRVEPSLAEAIAGHVVARADFVATATISEHHFVLIGPEGGWSDNERLVVPETVELGPSVLRAETAVVVAATLMVNCRNYLL